MWYSSHYILVVVVTFIAVSKVHKWAMKVLLFSASLFLKMSFETAAFGRAKWAWLTGLFMQTHTESLNFFQLHHGTNLRPQRLVVKLLRVVCPFLSRPDCYPQRLHRLAEGAEESEIRNTLNSAIWSNCSFFSLSRELSTNLCFGFFQLYSHTLELHEWINQRCSVCVPPDVIM